MPRTRDFFILSIMFGCVILFASIFSFSSREPIQESVQVSNDPGLFESYQNYTVSVDTKDTQTIDKKVFLKEVRESYLSAVREESLPASATPQLPQTLQEEGEQPLPSTVDSTSTETYENAHL